MSDSTRRATRGDAALGRRWQLDAGEFVTGAAWSDRASLAVIATAEGRVTAYATDDGATRWTSVLHPGGVLALAASPDGARVLAGGQDGTATLVDGATGAVIARWTSPQRRWVEHVAWAPRGGFGAVACGRVAKVVDAAGEVVFETDAHGSAIGALAWSPDGARLAVAAYGGVTVWDVAARTKATELPWKGSLISMAWSPDGAVIACGSQDATVHFWRLATGRDSEMSGFPAKPRALAWDARSSWLATGGSADVALWRFEGRGPEGAPPTVLGEQGSVVAALAFHPRRGVLAAGYLAGIVALWDVAQTAAPRAKGRTATEVSAMVWHPEGTALLTGDAAGVVTCWNVP